MCQLPPDIPNAEVTMENNTARYFCNPGYYQLENTDDFISCDGNIWQPTSFECIRKENATLNATFINQPFVDIFIKTWIIRKQHTFYKHFAFIVNKLILRSAQSKLHDVIYFSHYVNKCCIPNDTLGTYCRRLGFISNCHIRWNFCVKLNGKIFLRSSPFHDQCFNTMAFNRFNQNSALHLSWIKITPWQFYYPLS